jgi:hypothetical protein
MLTSHAPSLDRLAIAPSGKAVGRRAIAEGQTTLDLLASASLAVVLVPVLLYFGIRLPVAAPLSILLALTGQHLLRAAFNSGRLDLFSPLTLVAGYFALYFVMRSLYLCTVPFLTRLGRNPYDDYLPAALWCACVGYLSFLAGFGSNAAKTWKRHLPVATHQLPPALPASRLLFLILLGLGSLAYLFKIGVAVGNYGNLEFQRNPPPGVVLLLANLLDLSWVVICVYLVVPSKKSRRWETWSLLGISLGILGLKLAISGGKVALIQPLMEAGIVIHYGKRRFRLWEALILGVPSLMLAFGAVNFYRFVVVGRSGSPKTLSDIVSRISSAATMLNSNQVARAQPSALEQMVDRNAGTDALALIMKYTPHPFPYALGRPWLQIPMTFVPRQIWKNKPINIPSAEFEATYMGLPSNYNGFSSMQLIGDLYRNFSWAGALGGMFFLGALLRLFYLFCSPSRANTAGLFLYAALFPEVIHSLESDAGYAVINVSRIAALAIVVAIFLGARFRRFSRGTIYSSLYDRHGYL